MFQASRSKKAYLTANSGSPLASFPPISSLSSSSADFFFFLPSEFFYLLPDFLPFGSYSNFPAVPVYPSIGYVVVGGNTGGAIADGASYFPFTIAGAGGGIVGFLPSFILVDPSGFS